MKGHHHPCQAASMVLGETTVVCRKPNRYTDQDIKVVRTETTGQIRDYMDKIVLDKMDLPLTWSVNPINLKARLMPIFRREFCSRISRSIRNGWPL